MKICSYFIFESLLKKTFLIERLKIQVYRIILTNFYYLYEKNFVTKNEKATQYSIGVSTIRYSILISDRGAFAL